jgi:hypothetical protein
MTRRPYRDARSVFWTVDSGSAHQGATAAQRLRNSYRNPVVVNGPIHTSWLNQIEIDFSIVQRKFLAPNDFTPLMDLPRITAIEYVLYETAYKVGVKVWQRGARLGRNQPGRKGAAAVWCGESSQFHVLTFFRGTVSSPKSPSGTAKALVLNSE